MWLWVSVLPCWLIKYDDLLATGGTATAGVTLIERLGGIVIGCAFVIELLGLGGRVQLEQRGLHVHSCCTFDK